MLAEHTCWNYTSAGMLLKTERLVSLQQIGLFEQLAGVQYALDV
jgi:hypothetical protein